MEFGHDPSRISRLGVTRLPHLRRGENPLSTCRMASLRDFSPLSSFPRSLVNPSRNENIGTLLMKKLPFFAVILILTGCAQIATVKQTTPQFAVSGHQEQQLQ